MDDLQIRGDVVLGHDHEPVREVVHERSAFAVAREREAAKDARPARVRLDRERVVPSTGSTVAVTGGWSRVSRTTFVGVRSITSASRS